MTIPGPDLRRRFFLFGAAAAVAVPVARRIFIMPPVPKIIWQRPDPLRWLLQPYGRPVYEALQEVERKLMDDLARSFVGTNAIDREVLDSITGVADLMRGMPVPQENRYAVVPLRFARVFGLDLDSADPGLERDEGEA